MVFGLVRRRTSQWGLVSTWSFRERFQHILIFANLLWAGQEDRPGEVRNWSQVTALGEEQGFPRKRGVLDLNSIC